MRLLKKLTALTLSTVLAIGLLPLSAFADDSTATPLLKGKYSYAPSFEKEYTEDIFFYSDSYFESSAKETNEHLRTLSFILACSSFNAFLSESKAQNTIDFLSSVGFDKDSFAVADMEKTPTEDSIGTIIGHKKTDSGSIIAVAIRGGRYGSEWASNFKAGTTGDAEGFSEAAAKVIERIKTYEEQHSLKGAKIWIAGYSRAGAVSDLTGKYITEHTDEFGITADDAFIYTFEAPAASSTDPEYKNIHNVWLKYDIIPKVYPSQWELYHAGVDEMLEADAMTIKPKQFDIKFVGTGITDKHDDDEDSAYEPVDLDKFENDFISFVTKHITRADFDLPGKQVGNIITMMFRFAAKPADERKALTDYMKDLMGFSVISRAALTFNSLRGTEIGSAKYYEQVDDLCEIFDGAINDSDYSGVLTDEEVSMIKEALPYFLDIAVPILIEDFNNEHTLEMLSTMLSGMGDIVSQHAAQNISELIQNMDSYYNGEKSVEIKRGSARINAAELDRALVYKDRELEDLGFDETDIDFLQRGYDVSYELDIPGTTSLDTPDKSSNIRSLFEDYLKQQDITADEVQISSAVLSVTRGFNEPETTENEIKTSLSYELSKPLDGREVKLLKLADDEITELPVTASDDPDSNVTEAAFTYSGSGHYALVVLSPKAEPAKAAAAAVGKEIKKPDESSSSWLTVIGLTVGGLCIALAIATVVLKKKYHKN